MGYQSLISIREDMQHPPARTHIARKSREDRKDNTCKTDGRFHEPMWFWFPYLRILISKMR